MKILQELKSIFYLLHFIDGLYVIIKKKNNVSSAPIYSPTVYIFIIIFWNILSWNSLYELDKVNYCACYIKNASNEWITIGLSHLDTLHHFFAGAPSWYL